MNATIYIRGLFRWLGRGRRAGLVVPGETLPQFIRSQCNERGSGHRGVYRAEDPHRRRASITNLKNSRNPFKNQKQDESRKMARFVLIHGAWHGGWCWERVVPLLRAAGHQVLAPDLPGMGADRTPFAADVLGQWADFVADLVRGAPEPAVLVGHSRGGMVISEAAERAPDHVRVLVYVAAFLLPPGVTIRQKLNADGQSVLFKSLRMNQESASTTIEPDAASNLFYNLTSSEDSAAAVARLTPEPLASSARSLILTSTNFDRVRRVYIEAERDHALPLAIQRDMHGHLPCERVISISSDHSPFFSAPDQLAHALLDPA
jgi:pimeloyl-ACP methyl ester carboxylesterase